MVSTRESAIRGQSSQSQSVSDNIQDNWSDEDIQNNNMVFAREIYPTRFLDKRVLLKQGIKEQMEDLLDMMGTKILMTMEERSKKDTLGFRQEQILWNNIALDESYCISKARMSKLHDASGAPVNYGFSHVCQASEFLKHLMSNKEEEEEIGHDHEIAIGGMLTPFFRSLRIDLQDFEELPTAYMDEEYMVETKTCAVRFNEDSFMYSFMDERMVPQCCFLPNPRYSHTYSNDGIRFRIPQHLCFEVPYPRNQNPKHW
ncbi:unnamed protein product [Cochlearia groenlandica]